MCVHPFLNECPNQRFMDRMRDRLVDDVIFRLLLSVWLRCNDKKQLAGRADSSPVGVETVHSNVTHYIKQRGNC